MLASLILDNAALFWCSGSASVLGSPLEFWGKDFLSDLALPPVVGDC